MATRTTTTVWTNTNDADFRAWGSWISGGFAAFGWTLVYQNFETGTGWTDVTKPAAINTPRVIEVWAPNDALQATEPLFVKIEYGSSQFVTTPGLKVTFARVHLGSGSMATIFLDSGWQAPTANTNQMTHVASGDASRITIGLVLDGTSWSANSSSYFTIERRKNGSGVDQGTGWLLGLRLGGSFNRTLLTSGAANSPVVLNFPHPSVGGNVTDFVQFGRQQVNPLLFNGGGVEVGLNMVFVPSTVSLGTQISVSVLGSSRTYWVTKNTGLGTTSGATSFWVPALRFE